jgi:16S rRNA (cytosine967-C5)-methyltransferase
MAFRPAEARIRETLLELWAQSRADWRFVSERLSQAFRANKRLHSAERRVVAETLYGMVRFARTIDWALARGGVPAWSSDRGLEMPAERALLELFTYRILFEDMAPSEAEAERRDVDWLAVAGTHEAIAAVGDPVTRFALEHSLPDWLARRLLAEDGLDAHAFARAINGRAPLTLRANLLKTSRDAVMARLAASTAGAPQGLAPTPTRWSSHGLTLGARVNVFGLPEFRDGLFEVQDEASQLVAELTAPPVHGLVVDCCAGAGGKTLALGALMRNKGRLVAMDMAKHKLEELTRRARRAGLTNHRWMVIDAEGDLPVEARGMLGKADRVLVDAPCSGVGSMRRSPEARWRMSEAYVEALPALQLRIAERALPLLKEGGRLVYATCTILAAENEEVVKRLIEKEPRLTRIPVKEILGKARVEGLVSDDGFSMRTAPHVQGMDGFYATALRLGS